MKSLCELMSQNFVNISFLMSPNPALTGRFTPDCHNVDQKSDIISIELLIFEVTKGQIFKIT